MLLQFKCYNLVKFSSFFVLYYHLSKSFPHFDVKISIDDRQDEDDEEDDEEDDGEDDHQ